MDFAQKITVVEMILSLIASAILIALYYTTWWLYLIVFMDLTLSMFEFIGIQFKQIRLIIISGLIRTSWTVGFLAAGIILVVQETNKIFDWENSYLGYGILFIILGIYGIFRVGLQFKVFLDQKKENAAAMKKPSTTTTVVIQPV